MQAWHARVKAVNRQTKEFVVSWKLLDKCPSEHWQTKKFDYWVVRDIPPKLMEWEGRAA